jgi:GDP-D-mannose dehydratase
MSRTLLVTGATGKQGGAVINNTLKLNANFRILAVTWNPSWPAAQRLAASSQKIKLVQGDLDNCNDVFKVARSLAPEGVWGFVQRSGKLRSPLCVIRMLLLPQSHAGGSKIVAILLPKR